MPELAGFPYFQVQFDKEGRVFDAAEVRSLLDGVGAAGITDLVFVSHGWKNDIADATALYKELIGNVRAALDGGAGGGLAGRKLGFVGVFWPSKKYTPIELQPGGGASLEGVITADMLRKELDALAPLSDANDAEALIGQAKALVGELDDRKTAQDQFVELVLRILADERADPEVDAEVPKALEEEPGREILERLSRPAVGDQRTAGGGEAGFGDFFGGIKGGAMNLLNGATYWKMKKRAGKVGETGLHGVLKELKARHPNLSVHLVGHSFGGRLVAAAARGPDGEDAVPVKTMSLLQAAFSHNGFAEKFDRNRDGYFRRVVTGRSVAGPILITHTINDKAVGMAYPLASRVNRDDAAALGDRNDPFGGIGRNGAQHTAEAVEGELKGPGAAYAFEAGKLYNLKADGFIADHGDVRNAAVANAIVNVIAAV